MFKSSNALNPVNYQANCNEQSKSVTYSQLVMYSDVQSLIIFNKFKTNTFTLFANVAANCFWVTA